MEHISQFIINHWMLWSALVLIVILIIFEEFKDRLGGLQRISPQQLTQMINRDEVVIIDVRDKDAFASGHILNSIHIPLAELQANPKKLEKYKDKIIVLIGLEGKNVLSIGSKLRKEGYKLSNLHGGLTAWRNAGLPLTKQ